MRTHPHEGPTRYDEDERAIEDRRPIDVGTEQLGTALAQLDEELQRLVDRLSPVLSERTVPVGERLSVAMDGNAVDQRSHVVRGLDAMTEHVERLRERIEFVYHRLDA